MRIKMKIIVDEYVMKKGIEIERWMRNSRWD